MRTYTRTWKINKDPSGIPRKKKSDPDPHQNRPDLYCESDLRWNECVQHSMYDTYITNQFDKKNEWFFTRPECSTSHTTK